MKTILEKIQENAATCGEQDAYRLYVVNNYAGGGHKYSSLTWRELDILSGKLAARLCRDCRTNTPVVVYGHKDPLMLVCFLACVKSGRAYCPVDVSVPLNRVEAIIDAVKPELVLAVEPLKTSGGAGAGNWDRRAGTLRFRRRCVLYYLYLWKHGDTEGCSDHPGLSGSFHSVGNYPWAGPR